MDKILIYTNNLQELTNIAPLLNKLEQEDFEVAFATDDNRIVQFLTQNKQLVVKFGTYYPDYYISNTKLPGVTSISIKEFEGMLK